MNRFDDYCTQMFVTAYVALATIEDPEAGLVTSETAVLTGIGITIASLAGALLWVVTQAIIGTIPNTVTYPS